MIEPRTDDIQEIAKSKIEQAYMMLKQPCIALDSGFFVEALNGFPRAFVNFTLDTIGIKGTLANEIRRLDSLEKWSDLWYIFIPEYSSDDSSDGRTLAEFSQNEHSKRREKIDSSIKMFEKWYEKCLDSMKGS